MHRHRLKVFDGELPEFIENPALPDEVKQKLLYANAKRLYRIA